MASTAPTLAETRRTTSLAGLEPDLREDRLILLTALGRVPLLRHLRAEQRAELLQAARRRDYPAGAEIVREGEVAEGLIVVLAGAAELEQGDELLRLGPGDFLEELAACEVVLARDTARALVDVRAAVVRAADLYDVLRGNPDVSLSLLRGAVTRLHGAEASLAERSIALLHQQTFEYATDLAALVEREHDASTQLRNSLLATIRGLAQLVESRQPGALQHAARVGRRAQAIALRLGLGEELASHGMLAGLLHDAGTALLFPVGAPRPDGSTFAHLMRLHPLKGVELIKGIAALQPLEPLIAQHHEALDGSGYPAGLSGAAISPGGRVMAVAEAYEEQILTLRGVSGQAEHDALASLGRVAGFKLDREAVAALRATVLEPHAP